MLLHKGVLSPATCRRWRALINEEFGTDLYKVRDVLRKSSQLRRAVLESPVADLIGHTPIVRSILFQKPSSFNWRVPWHQDVLIQVREQRDLSGYGPWSIKEGVPHVQPPLEVLQSIRSFRIHLSDCGPGDGPLRVLPGSESQGLIDFGGLDRSAADDGIAILADAGDVLEFSPLCLHASDANQAGGMRAILHIEVSDYQFDNGLEWFGRIAI